MIGPVSPAPSVGPATEAIVTDELLQFRQSMRRLTGSFAELPAETQATCPTCRNVVPATFDRIGEQVVLTFQCDKCGPARQVHHDTIWTNLKPDYPGSAATTFAGSRIHPQLRRLPRTVQTLCPTCSAIILGRYFVQDGAVYIEKTCPDHSYVRDCINSDALLYSKAAWWSYEERPGLEKPHVTGGKNCPSDCGLCNQHISTACLAQIDLTNRCNMNCPICFANAGVTGSVSELTYDQAVHQLRMLRELHPVPCTAIQFTGGEPTIHPDFLRIVSAARDMGFSHIQIATNGLQIADETFARAAARAGLHTLYMQFDGVGDDAHEYTRNFPGLWERKLAAIENCRKIGMKICLVPTILKGVNDDQVGKIFNFAVENIDVISAISYQPVSFTGRIAENERRAQRYTLGDLAGDIASASGAHPLRDMFPLSIVMPLSQLLEAITGKTKVHPSCHTDCAFGSYFLVSPEGKAYPFPQVINVEGMFTEMNRIAARIRRKGKANWLDKLSVLQMFKRHFNQAAAPPGLTVTKFIRSLMGMLDKKVGRGKGEKLTYKTLLCAGMHFQDRFNFDAERAKRCVILYSTPSGLFPFCTFNCGPTYRPLTEAAYAGRLAGRAPATKTDDPAAQVGATTAGSDA